MASIVAFREVPLGNLTIGTGQVRTRDVGKDIDELADSIGKVGLLEPIVVAPTDETDRFEIITGQRRFLAHRELGKDAIWAAVLDERVDEITAKVLSVTENLVRRDLNSNDLIDVCTYLYKRYGSVNAVCEETGLSHAKVSQYVKYDQLIPNLKEMVDRGEVKLDTALRAQRAAQASGNDDPTEAIQFAKEMDPMSGAQRAAIVKARESAPERSADDILEEAKSGGRLSQTVVTLSTEVHGALRQYAAAQDTTVDDAAGMLIREALYLNDFLDER